MQDGIQDAMITCLKRSAGRDVQGETKVPSDSVSCTIHVGQYDS